MLAFLVLSWGSAIVLTRVAVSDVPPIWVTAGRVITGALALVLYRFVVIRQSWSLGWNHLPWVIWLGLVSSALPFLLIAWGSQYTGSAIAGILMATIPLSVLGLAHVMLPDEKLTRGKAVGFLIGFIGVLLIIKPDSASLGSWGETELIGQIAIFLASLCYALNAVTTRRMPPADNIDKATAVLIAAALMMLVACLLFEPFSGLGSISLEKWLILVYLGLFPTALAGLILFVLLEQTTAGFVATSNYLVPVVTAIGGIAFLGERLSANVWLGFAVIMVGLAISQRKKPVS